MLTPEEHTEAMGVPLIIALVIFLATLIIFSRQKLQEPIEDGVWICTGAYATKYHCDRDCKGLNMCGSTIKQIPLEEAEAQGRTECQWCY